MAVSTCVIGPQGELPGRLDYGRAGVLAVDIDPGLATGEMAKRYSPERNRLDRSSTVEAAQDLFD